MKNPTSNQELTTRQREILALFAADNNTKQIAAELNCSPKTIEHHRAQFRKKIGTSTYIGMFKCAVKLGMVKLCVLFCFCAGAATISPFPPAPLYAKSVPVPVAITNITLAWDASASTNVAGYRIYWGPAAWMFTNSIAVGKVTNATINLRSNANYYFAATAYDSTGLESPFSNLAFGTTWPAPVQSLTDYIFLYSVNLIPGITNLILSSTNAAGPWITNVTVLGTTNQFTMLVTNTGPKKFYRVKF